MISVYLLLDLRNPYPELAFERLSRGPGIRTFFAQRLECGLLKPFCWQGPNVGSPRAFERKTGALLLWMVSSLVVPECALRKTFFCHY